MASLTKLSRSIEGKVALITGAASGMGRATAMLFADEGAKVAVSDLSRESVEAVVSQIRDAGGDAHGWVLDVSQLKEIEQVVDEVADHFGGLDILINNAGISRPGPVEGPDFEVEWDRTFAVNLTAHARLIRAALPHLTKHKTGRVVNIASTEGMGAQPLVSAYTASKHGVVGLTKAAALEYA